MKIEIKEKIGDYETNIIIEGANVDNLLTQQLANKISKHIVDNLKVKDK